MKQGRILKALSSLKMAVVVIVALGAITAWGTFVEAEYGEAAAAQKLVYHSPWMFLVMIALAVNLTAVMIDRWPWKQRHTGFILAHIGIIILLIGSVVTKYKGVDGSLSFGIGETSRHVVVGETDFTVYTSLDGSQYRKIFDQEVDFFLKPPTEQKPLTVEMPTGQLKVVEYFPYAFREQKIVEAKDDKSGAAIRFQLQNANVSLTEWLVQPGAGREAAKDLGPARVIFAPKAENATDTYFNLESRNLLVLRPARKGEGIDYEVHTARTPGQVKRGTTAPGGTVETGWMGMVLRVIKYLPRAKEEISFKKFNRSTPLTTAAIKVLYNNETHWMAANSLLKLFSEEAVFVVTYANRRIDINFDLLLKEFKVGRYPGTMRAASYESVVDVPGKGPTTISMNEPLHHNGFTFYQASFQEDESGRPVASVLSVNWDPGRWVKYLGSLLIVLGTIHLFYFRRRAAAQAAKTKTTEEVAEAAV